MTDIQSPLVNPERGQVVELRQVTIASDEEISQVNELLADGWRLLNVGYLARGVVYVLGRGDDKPRRRTGFIAGE